MITGQIIEMLKISLQDKIVAASRITWAHKVFQRFNTLTKNNCIYLCFGKLYWKPLLADFNLQHCLQAKFCFVLPLGLGCGCIVDNKNTGI